MEQRILTISLEKARELYKNGNEDIKSLLLETFTKEELEQSQLPKTWEEYCENTYCKGYYLNSSSRIKPFTGEVCNTKLQSECDKNTFESIENAEAILALCQLIRLRDEYNEHIPVADINIYPCAIKFDVEYDEYIIIPIVINLQYKSLFVFHNEELAQEFIKNFKPLLDKFYKIMY